MKKIFLLSMLLFASLLLKANPIVTTPFRITELYFDNTDKWTMELLIEYPINFNLDNYKLVTSLGEFQFKSGIHAYPNDIILITSDSMQTPLTLSRIGDFIEVKEYYFSQWNSTSIPTLRYGNVANANLSSPRIGQSICLLIINYTIYPNTFKDYIYVKTNIASLGSFSNYPLSNYNGILNGYVYDNTTNPVSSDSVLINFLPNNHYSSIIIHPDTSGYFSNYLIACNNRVRIYYPKSATTPYLDTIINVEPDSTVSCVFHINNYISGINDLNAYKPVSVSNFPNPFKDNATIIIKIPNSNNYSKAIIKFFNSLGEIVKIIPIDGLNKNVDSYHIPLSVSDNFKLTTGTYYYVLELNGEKVASNKMTLIK